MAQRVVDLVRSATRIEADSAPFPAAPERVAVVVHWSASPVLTRSFTTLVHELLDKGYFVVVSSACEADSDLEWPAGMPRDTIVIRKPNIGYDFGTAAVAIDRFPALAAAPYVLVVNDSNVGPFRPLDEIIADFENTEADAWALTGSNQHGFHLQSFFLGFRGGIVGEPALRGFWRDIRHFTDKYKVIERYEIGLSRLLMGEGYSIDVMYPHSAFDGAANANLSVNLWLDLLAVGYPFIKRELVNKPWVDPSAVRVRTAARSYFGEDIDSWL